MSAFTEATGRVFDSANTTAHLDHESRQKIKEAARAGQRWFPACLLAGRPVEVGQFMIEDVSVFNPFCHMLAKWLRAGDYLVYVDANRVHSGLVLQGRDAISGEPFDLHPVFPMDVSEAEQALAQTQPLNTPTGGRAESKPTATKPTATPDTRAKTVTRVEDVDEESKPTASHNTRAKTVTPVADVDGESKQTATQNTKAKTVAAVENVHEERKASASTTVDDAITNTKPQTCTSATEAHTTAERTMSINRSTTKYPATMQGGKPKLVQRMKTARALLADVQRRDDGRQHRQLLFVQNGDRLNVLMLEYCGLDGMLLVYDELDHCSNRYCHWCGAAGARRKCTQCGTRYCHKDCQRQDWQVHKQYCKSGPVQH